MLDVVVINSPLFREAEPGGDEDTLPPMGLALVATALHRAGLRVELIDAVADRMPLDELTERVCELKPPVVAVNLFTTNYVLVKEFVESIACISAHVIVGGLVTVRIPVEAEHHSC